MLIGFLAFCFLRYAVFLSFMTRFHTHIMCVFCFILLINRKQHLWQDVWKTHNIVVMKTL